MLLLCHGAWLLMLKHYCLSLFKKCKIHTYIYMCVYIIINVLKTELFLLYYKDNHKCIVHVCKSWIYKIIKSLLKEFLLFWILLNLKFFIEIINRITIGILHQNFKYKVGISYWILYLQYIVFINSSKWKTLFKKQNFSIIII